MPSLPWPVKLNGWLWVGILDLNPLILVVFYLILVVSIYRFWTSPASEKSSLLATT
jgi:uncharacterized membrane protein